MYHAGSYPLPCGQTCLDIGINYVTNAVFDEPTYHKHINQCNPCKGQYDRIMSKRDPVHNKDGPEALIFGPDGREEESCSA